MLQGQQETGDGDEWVHADPAGIEAAQAGAKASLPDAPDIEAGASVLEDGSRPEAASSAAAAAVAEMLDGEPLFTCPR